MYFSIIHVSIPTRDRNMLTTLLAINAKEIAVISGEGCKWIHHWVGEYGHLNTCMGMCNVCAHVMSLLSGIIHIHLTTVSQKSTHGWCT